MYSKLQQIGKSSQNPKSNHIAKGQKTIAWEKAIIILKKQFEEWGIRKCELQLEGCWQDNSLSFAHVDKRKNLMQGELMAVVLACVPCHQKIEALPSVRMRAIVEEIIKNRII